jgi:hypothetical protein
MSHTTRRSTGRPSSSQRHLSKAMLLPLKTQTASDISLANHLALAVCRKGRGSAHLINELTKVVFLTYHLQKSGFGAAPPDLYDRANVALKLSVLRARRDGVWQVGADDAVLLAEILAVHDQQLIEAAAWKVFEAKLRFDRSIKRGICLPVRTTNRRSSLATL